jgi:hypothetical protein
MRKPAFIALFVLALTAFPAWAQEYPQALEQLLEQRLKALKRLHQEDCSPLVLAATQAGIQRTEESIRRLFPSVAAQFDQTGWPAIANPPGESFNTGQVPTPELNLQGQDEPSESPSLASPMDAGHTPLLEESAQVVAFADRGGAAASIEPASARNEVSEANAIVLKLLSIELSKGRHALSYAVTNGAEIILGTYLPDEVAFQGGLYLFYFRNTSDHPVDISARNFTLVDRESDNRIRVKTSAEVRTRANPFVGFGKTLGGLLRSAAHLGDRGMLFGHSDESRSNLNDNRAIDAGPAKITAVQVSGVEMGMDYQSRLAECLRDMSVNRSDWLYWVKARILSEYTVKPGEEIIRFVSTGSSNRSHRHILRFKSHDTEASLTSAEKGLR